MKKQAFIPDEELQAIKMKIVADRSGATLTEKEKNRQIVKEEVAYLLEVLAGRDVPVSTIKSLIRHDKGARLRPCRVVGSTFFYQVKDLLPLKFNKMKKVQS